MSICQSHCSEFVGEVGIIVLGVLIALAADALVNARVGSARSAWPTRTCSLHPNLTADVNEQNSQAVGFYERLGFVRIGRSSTDE